MLITIPGTIINGKSASAQMVVRFYMPNGNPLLANSAEPNFRDINGLAATGTVVLPIFNDPAQTGSIPVSIPYYALNLIPTGGMTNYSLTVVATLYVNQFEKAKSPPFNIVVRF